MQSKDQIRNQMKKERALMNLADKKKYDGWVCQELLKIINENMFKVVHCYLPMGSEIDITPFIHTILDNGLTVVCPKTLPNRKLENRILSKLSNVEQGVYGTRHPKTKEVYSSEIDLIVVPGLAFDFNNFRLGYGGGYYDTFMEDYSTSYKVGLAYPFQMLTNVSIEQHDIRLNRIIVKESN